jgi:hypothetical protein
VITLKSDSSFRALRDAGSPGAELPKAVVDASLNALC